MSSSTFVCPECDTALRGADKVPAGKKVKCPSCAAIFIMPERKNVGPSMGIRDKPLPSVPARTVRDERDEPEEEARRSKRRDRSDDDEETPRRRGRAAAEEADDAGARTRRKSQVAAEDEVVDEEFVDEEYREEDEVVEDRPRKKRRKKRKAQRGGKGLLVGLIAGVVSLLLGGGGLAAYFIFFAGTNNVGVDVEAWAFVQPDANFVAGIDVASLMSDPAIGPQIETLIRRQASGNDFLDNCKKETGLEFKELCAQVVWGVTIDPGAMGGNPFGGMAGGQGMGFGRAGGGNLPPTTMVWKSSKSFSQSRVGRSLKNATRKKLNGKTYYEVTGQSFNYVYMPSNRHIVVLANANESQLAAVLGASADKPTVSADTTSLIRGAAKSTVWFAMPFEGKMRELIQQAAQLQPAAAQPMAEAMTKAKGFGFWANLDANALKIGFNMLCADANSASQLAAQGDALLQQQKGEMAQLDALLRALPKTKGAITELMNSFKYTSEGATLMGTGQIARQTVNGVIQEIQGLAGQFQGAFGGGQPGGGIPGGMGPGGGMPGGGKGGQPGGGGRKGGGGKGKGGRGGPN